MAIQKHLRVWYSDSGVSILVFKHMMIGHYSVYLSSTNEGLYRKHVILYRMMETFLKMSGLFVLSFEVIAPLSKIIAPRSPPEINHFELVLDDPGDDESQSNEWPLDDLDIWKSWI